MPRVQIALMLCLGVLALLIAPRGIAQSARATGRPAALAPEAWYIEPEAGMLLVATRELRDPVFSETVILLLNHSIAGSQGLIVNQRSQLHLPDVITGIDASADKHPVFFGGPLGTDQVFMLLHGGNAVPGTQQVTDDIRFSSSRRVIEDLLADRMPVGELRIYLGYASWITGQLAMEIARGSWLLVRGDTGMVFDAAGKGLWERLIDELEPDGILVSLEPQRRIQPTSVDVACCGSRRK